jgi:glycine cleavage system regulatory protein
MRNGRCLKVLVARDSYGKVGHVVRALLDGGAFDVSVRGVCPFSRVADFLTDDTQAVVLALSDADNLSELRELVSRFPETAFLLVADKPTRPALARLADTLGAGLVAADDPPVVMTATLSSLLAQHARRLEERKALASGHMADTVTAADGCG